LPVLLITLYFVPPLGVALTIARYFIYGSYRYYRVPAVLLVIGCLCLIPRAYELLLQNVGAQIPIIQPLIDFRTHQLYPKITDFGRFIAIFSIITLIASQLLRNLIGRASSALRMLQAAKTASDSTEKTAKTSIMTHDNPAKQPSDQTTPHVVKCANCGKACQIIGTVGKCKYCRNAVEWHSKSK
jgi:hypothetical protein